MPQTHDQICRDILKAYFGNVGHRVLRSSLRSKGMYDVFQADFSKLKQTYPMLNIETYNVAFRYVSRGGNIFLMEHLYKQMLSEGIEPSIWTFTNMISAAALTGNIDYAVTAMKRIRKANLKPHTATHHACMRLFSQRRDRKKTDEVIQSALRDGAVPDTYMLESMAYASTSYADAMASVHSFAKLRVVPDSFVYTAILSACSYKGETAMAERTLNRALADNTVEVNYEVYAKYVYAMQGSGDHELVVSAVQRLQRAGYTPDMRVTSYYLKSCLSNTTTKYDRYYNEAVALYARSLSEGLLEIPLLTNMVAIYAKYGQIDEIEKIRSYLQHTMKRGETEPFFEEVRRGYINAGREDEAGEPRAYRVADVSFAQFYGKTHPNQKKASAYEQGADEFPARFSAESGYNIAPQRDTSLQVNPTEQEKRHLECTEVHDSSANIAESITEHAPFNRDAIPPLKARNA